MTGGFLEDEEEEEDEVGVIDVDSETSAPSPDHEQSLVRPAADLEEVSAVYKQFEEMKEGLLKKGEDTTTIGKGKSKSTFVNKSGWRKIATAFNVSVEVVQKEKEVSDGVLTWRVLARAVAPNGKTAESWSTCASNESNHMEYLQSVGDDEKKQDDVFKVDGKWRRLKDPREVNEHDILATSETRAKNRAISDLVGGGSVSAEEVTKESVLE